VTSVENPSMCAQTDPELWYPPQPNNRRATRTALAITMCGECVVFDTCIDGLIPDEYGIQAGMTPREQVAWTRHRDGNV
jgi:hypothetical protein